eukprot:8969262-Alexandrium_andersonii.AAC.1
MLGDLSPAGEITRPRHGSASSEGGLICTGRAPLRRILQGGDNRYLLSTDAGHSSYRSRLAQAQLEGLLQLR